MLLKWPFYKTYLAIKLSVDREPVTVKSTVLMVSERVSRMGMIGVVIH